MKKQYTDSDIQKLLTDLAELVPEINPTDSEWREFLREFIAARPNVQLDEAFAKEVRQKLVQRAVELNTKKRFSFPQWLKLGGTFVAGAAVCAAVIIPILKTPESIQINDAVDFAPSSKILSGGVAENNSSVSNRMMKSLKLEEAEEIPEFELAPMMAQEIAVPTSQSMPDSVGNEAIIGDPGTLNSEVGVEPATMNMNEPMMALAIDSQMEKIIPQLRWEDVPSDADILDVAIKAFEKNNFDTLGLNKPFIDKWWENREVGVRLEFAPDKMSVVFGSDWGEEVRIEVNVLSLEVVSVIHSE